MLSSSQYANWRDSPDLAAIIPVRMVSSLPSSSLTSLVDSNGLHRLGMVMFCLYYKLMVRVGNTMEYHWKYDALPSSLVTL